MFVQYGHGQNNVHVFVSVHQWESGHELTSTILEQKLRECDKIQLHHHLILNYVWFGLNSDRCLIFILSNLVSSDFNHRSADWSIMCFAAVGVDIASHHVLRLELVSCSLFQC